VERPKPTEREVLVKVHATTVNRSDTGFRIGRPFVARPFSGFVRPRKHILGTEFAGEVVEVGGAVTEFALGDRVFGLNPFKFGAHAEFVSMRAEGPIALMPNNVSFEVAEAVCDGATNALPSLRKANVTTGTRVLIYGASGSIGTAGVQLAKYLGAYVTAV
jgi:NADPH:quinone reductase-like Zn-dependent oxidoreductase